MLQTLVAVDQSMAPNLGHCGFGSRCDLSAASQIRVRIQAPYGQPLFRDPGGRHSLTDAKRLGGGFGHDKTNGIPIGQRCFPLTLAQFWLRLACSVWSRMLGCTLLIAIFIAFCAIHPFSTLTRALAPHCTWANSNYLFFAFTVTNVQQNRHAE